MDQPVAAPVDEAGIAALPADGAEDSAAVLVGPPARWDAEQQQRWEAERLRLREGFERTLAEGGDWQTAQDELLEHALAKGAYERHTETLWVIERLIRWKEQLAEALEANGGADQQDLARHVRSTTKLQRTLYGFPAETVPMPAPGIAPVRAESRTREQRSRRRTRLRSPARGAQTNHRRPASVGRLQA